jgi:hypothetical protein
MINKIASAFDRLRSLIILSKKSKIITKFIIVEFLKS